MYINAFVVFAEKHIAAWLPELNARYPKLQIELMQTDDFIDPLTDAADLLFRYGPLQDSGISCPRHRPPRLSVRRESSLFGAIRLPQEALQISITISVSSTKALWAQRALLHETWP